MPIFDAIHEMSMLDAGMNSPTFDHINNNLDPYGQHNLDPFARANPDPYNVQNFDPYARTNPDPFAPANFDPLAPAGSLAPTTNLNSPNAIEPNGGYPNCELTHGTNNEFGYQQCLGHSQPLANMEQIRFTGIQFYPNDQFLVDIDGDGIADQTIWGTPVIYVEGYHRTDGTWVEAHYRTVPDGIHANNISAHR
jgi:hypothetical protein